MSKLSGRSTNSIIRETVAGHTAKQANPVPLRKDAVQRTSDWVHNSATYCADARAFDQAGLKRAARLHDVVGVADRAMHSGTGKKSRTGGCEGRLKEQDVEHADLKDVGAWAKEHKVESKRW